MKNLVSFRTDVYPLLKLAIPLALTGFVQVDFNIHLPENFEIVEEIKLVDEKRRLVS